MHRYFPGCREGPATRPCTRRSRRRSRCRRHCSRRGNARGLCRSRRSRLGCRPHGRRAGLRRGLRDRRGGCHCHWWSRRRSRGGLCGRRWCSRSPCRCLCRCLCRSCRGCRSGSHCRSSAPELWSPTRLPLPRPAMKTKTRTTAADAAAVPPAAVNTLHIPAVPPPNHPDRGCPRRRSSRAHVSAGARRRPDSTAK